FLKPCGQRKLLPFDQPDHAHHKHGQINHDCARHPHGHAQKVPHLCGIAGSEGVHP
ncbi:Bacteriocin-type signal sequence-containing protein, partial [Dysosmobacter welbionis]